MSQLTFVANRGYLSHEIMANNDNNPIEKGLNHGLDDSYWAIISFIALVFHVKHLRPANRTNPLLTNPRKNRKRKNRPESRQKKKKKKSGTFAPPTLGALLPCQDPWEMTLVAYKLSDPIEWPLMLRHLTGMAIGIIRSVFFFRGEAPLPFPLLLLLLCLKNLFSILWFYHVLYYCLSFS